MSFFSDHTDEYGDEDLHGTDSGGDDDSDSDASVSSFSSSELPDESFEPMPEHLTLPLELQQRILGQETSQFQLMWGTYRFVSRAWKEHVEFLAKTEWVTTGAFEYPGYMIRHPKDGKVFLCGFFEFLRLDGDTAVFQAECAREYHKNLVVACKATAPPDVQVCGFVHDVPIAGMEVEWKTLIITCPWRAIVGRVLAEELRVEAYRARTNRRMMTKVKRLRSGGMDKIGEALDLFAAHLHGAYAAVRKARLGRADKRGDERLKQARVAASWRLLAAGDESEEEEEEEDSDSNSSAERESDSDESSDEESGVYHLNLHHQSEDSDAYTPTQ
ncbi:hypothetical protein FB45DRAFT_1025831 [Roridomyces roridus]|uniref:Uncharacterized protein n=1 Tax=Roridomyces roridus TaxID=1738132 RepID=A0AAD7FS19_9AGAR|nr:hypothetical protein FB45DRAFT_1025831 [Roridomyces roridus]